MIPSPLRLASLVLIVFAASCFMVISGMSGGYYAGIVAASLVGFVNFWYAFSEEP